MRNREIAAHGGCNLFVSRKPRDSRVVQKKASADDVEIETPFVVK